MRTNNARDHKYQGGAGRLRDPLEHLGGKKTSAATKAASPLGKEKRYASTPGGILAGLASAIIGPLVGAAAQVYTKKKEIETGEREGAAARAAAAVEAHHQRAEQERDRQHELRAEAARLAEERKHAEALAAQRRAERALEAEENRREDERLAQRLQSGPSTTQSRQQAVAFVNQMRARYPHVFASYPQTANQIEGDALRVLLAPSDPGNPNYAKEALAEIEYNTSLTEARLKPGNVPPPEPVPQAGPPARIPRKEPLAYARGRGRAQLGCGPGRSRPGLFGAGLVAVNRP